MAEAKGKLSPVPGETDLSTLSDRQLLMHVLMHVEDISAKVDTMHATLEQYRPLLDKFTSPGARAVAKLTTRRGALPWQP